MYQGYRPEGARYACRPQSVVVFFVVACTMSCALSRGYVKTPDAASRHAVGTLPARSSCSAHWLSVLGWSPKRRRLWPDRHKSILCGGTGRLADCPRASTCVAISSRSDPQTSPDRPRLSQQSMPERGSPGVSDTKRERQARLGAKVIIGTPQAFSHAARGQNALSKGPRIHSGEYLHLQARDSHLPHMPARKEPSMETSQPRIPR